VQRQGFVHNCSLADLQVMDEVRAAMADHPGYRLLVVGHSMGAGTAAILTMMCAVL
jgi:pimeloyl-ACP methyl ester carboxylesterase